MLKTLSSHEETFKCGMVYCSTSAVYSVHCHYCDENVKFDDFQKHFRIKHFSLIRKEKEVEEPQRCLRSSTAIAITTRANTVITSFAGLVSVPTTTTVTKNPPTSSRLICSPIKVATTTTTAVAQEKSDPINIEMTLKSDKDKQEEDDDDTNFFEDEVPIDMVALGLNQIESTLTNPTEPIVDVSKSITKEEKDEDDSDDSLFESDDDNVPKYMAAKSDSDSLFDSDDSRFEYNIKKKPKKDQSFPCDVCGKRFKIQRGLKAHKSRLHKTSDIIKKTSTPPTTNKSKETENSADSPKRKVIEKPLSSNTSQTSFKCSVNDFSTNDSTSDAVQQQLDIALATLDNENVTTENVDTEREKIIDKEQSATSAVAASSQPKKPTNSTNAELSSDSDDFEEEFQDKDNDSEDSLFESDDTTDLPSIRKKKPVELNVQCDLCDKRVRTEMGLMFHKRDVHNIKEPATEGNAQDIEYTCELCGKSFNSNIGLFTHNAIVHSLESKKRAELAAWNAQQESRCEHCNDLFIGPKALRNHIQKAHTEYKCDICGNTYKSNYTLTEHVRQHTAKDKKYKCPECDAAFCTKKLLRSHSRRHIKPEPRICDICGKLCRDTTAFSKHVRRHTGDRPFKCNVCGKGFFEGYDRNIHELGHYDNKPFTCDVCGGAFRHRRALRVHKKSHVSERNFGCELCEKRFISEKGLKEHMRSHNKTGSLIDREEENLAMQEELQNVFFSQHV